MIFQLNRLMLKVVQSVEIIFQETKKTYIVGLENNGSLKELFYLIFKLLLLLQNWGGEIKFCFMAKKKYL